MMPGLDVLYMVSYAFRVTLIVQLYVFKYKRTRSERFCYLLLLYHQCITPPLARAFLRRDGAVEAER